MYIIQLDTKMDSCIIDDHYYFYPLSGFIYYNISFKKNPFLLKEPVQYIKRKEILVIEYISYCWQESYFKLIETHKTKIYRSSSDTQVINPCI